MPISKKRKKTTKKKSILINRLANGLSSREDVIDEFNKQVKIVSDKMFEERLGSVHGILRYAEEWYKIKDAVYASAKIEVIKKWEAAGRRTDNLDVNFQQQLMIKHGISQ